ncbi:WD40-repeat-containing domain protein [Hysterangium stoloniferum]|nr:WD40-repeat-containing domain protein [Hysterangium stoloniferum]
MFFCAISGEPPQDPVVSQKSGHVYERRLITKYITENGTEPMTGEKLEESDLIAIQANPKTSAPRPPNLTSIPSLLHTLQNEWDALVLETFALKQQYNSTRQELSHALYQQDAATRVAARLIRERDAAREALANVKATMGLDTSGSGADVEMQENAEEPGLPENVVAEIEELSKTLSSTRKKRKPPPEYPTATQVGGYAVKHTITSLHSSSNTGINSLALSQTQPSLFLTGGNDKIVQLYDRDAGKVAATLKGHTKKVNVVQFREKDGESNLILSGSADKTARIWAHDAASNEYAPQQTIKTHKGEITGLAIHPTRTILALASADKTYSLHSLSTFQQIFQSGLSDDAFTALAIHPDGALLALGSPNSAVHIYDMRSGKIGASLVPEGVTADSAPFTVNTLSFSENGYHLMAPSSANTVAIWDLRKQRESHAIQLGEGFKLNKVVYDPSAQFLGVAGSGGATIFAHKSWDVVAKFNEGDDVSDLAFSQDGREIWGVSGRELKIWGEA